MTEPLASQVGLEENADCPNPTSVLSPSSFMRALFLCVAYVLVIGIMSGCGSETAEKGLHLDAMYQEGDALHATEIAKIGDDAPLIGNPLSLALNSEGTLYISDFDNDRVHVVSAEGDSIDTIGQSGQGPGEFQDPSTLTVGPSDSLFVEDGRRISVFSSAPQHEFAYSFRLPVNDAKLPGGLHKTGSGALLASYSRPKNPNFERDPGIWLMRVDRNENILDELYQMPQDEYHVRVQNGHHRSVERPFGRKAFYSYTDTGVCYGWSDSLRVRCGDAQGHDSLALDVDHTALPVTSSEIGFYRDIYDGEELAMIEEAGFHDTHPAYEALHVDSEGRFWVQEASPKPDKPLSPEEAEETMVAWHRIDPTDETYQTIELPVGQTIEAATDTHVYTTMVPARPNVWIYRLDE